MAKTKETETVTGSGNSQYASQAGEGPVTDASFATGSEVGSSESIARQEGDPTILSHDLGDEGQPKAPDHEREEGVLQRKDNF